MGYQPGFSPPNSTQCNKPINPTPMPDKVTIGDNTAGTTSSTTYTTSLDYFTEKGWECPRCKRINAPWVRQCDCSGYNWTITNTPNTSPWWTQLPTTITCKNPSNVTYYSNPSTIGKIDSSVCASDSSKTVTVQAFNDTVKTNIGSNSTTRVSSDNPWYQLNTPTIELNNLRSANQYTIEQLDPPRGGSSQQDN